MIQSLQPKGREFESSCVFFLPLFDSFNFIYYRCTTTSEKRKFGSFYVKRLMRNAYNEPACPKHIQRLLENIVPYYSQNIWLTYSLYKLFELKFSGKTSEEKYAASLGTKAKQILFKYLRLL